MTRITATAKVTIQRTRGRASIGRMLASLVVFLALTGPAFAQSVYETADELDLLPTPREIRLNGNAHVLDEWQIVVPRNVGWALVAAGELNTRIVELGAAPLPVKSVAETGRPAIYIGRWRDAHVRKLATALSVTLTPADPGEQGYVIAAGRFNGLPAALLGGSDTQGALYASVTFRRLIQRRGDDVVFLDASVRDWPDFKIRSNGDLDVGALRETSATLGNLEPLDRAVEELKEQVDFHFRHKVNYVRVRTLLPPGGADARLYLEQYRRAREVVEYAQARGMTIREHGGVDVADYLSADERAEALERREGTSYMWSALDAHRRNAENYAKYLLGENGLFSLHPYDGGGYVNPTRWNDRGPATRAMYGDDRAWADLEQFLMYFEVIRETQPDVELEAVVYPYHYQLARDDFPERYEELSLWMPSKGGWFGGLENAEAARQIQKDLIEYNNYLDEHLPDGTAIVFRESDRQTFDALRNLYEGHPITIWIYPGRNGGWLGSFTPQVRYAKTWFDPNHRDHFFLASDMTRNADGRVIRLAQQEYLWNVDRPDASADFDNMNRFYEHGGREVTSFQKEHLIPRIARILYGDAADPYASLISANLSFDYVMHPEEMSETAWSREYFDEPYRYMEEQAAAMARVHAAFAPVVEDAKSDAWSVHYYRYTGLASVRAELEAALARARAADAAEALTVARNMVDRLPDLQKRVDSIRRQSDAAWATIPPRYIYRPAFKGDNLDVLDTFEPSEYRDAFGHFL